MPSPAAMPAPWRIDDWAAWAPGIETQAAWRAWIEAPAMPALDMQAPVLEMPTMMRRRIDALGRAALQTAYALQSTAAGECPVIFASRWGEMGRCAGMLEQLALGQPLSPTSFSLSVHNAIGALYSIARQDRANYLAVSAGEYSAEAGFAEAQGLLADGASAVLLVVFDAALPSALSQFAPAGQLQFVRAWACLLRSAEAGDAAALQLSSALKTAASSDPYELLPADLRTLAFLIGEQASLQQGPWIWRRDGG